MSPAQPPNFTPVRRRLRLRRSSSPHLARVELLQSLRFASLAYARARVAL